MCITLSIEMCVLDLKLGSFGSHHIPVVDLSWQSLTNTKKKAARRNKCCARVPVERSYRLAEETMPAAFGNHRFCGPQ
jgi:hypothetical protein